MAACHRGARDARPWRPARRAVTVHTRSVAALPTCSGSEASSASKVEEPFPWSVELLLQRSSAPEPLPMGGVILRGALTESEQEWLYNMLHETAIPDSGELNGLHATATKAAMQELNPDNRPQPWVTWVHPYTRQSNAKSRPTRLLEWAQQLMHALVPASRRHVVDSMLAQLYALGGSLLRHRDEDLSWGIGVSLGSAAEFDCLPEAATGEKSRRVLIRSGDIIVGEFGLMPHAVRVPPKLGDEGEANAPPPWYRRVERFGTKRRCNVLFRQALTEQQQLTLAEERSRKVYGMSLASLRKQTGHDNAFLAVHLRHAAVD